MSADELKEWLGSEESTGSGWSKDDGSGETIGHERYCHCPKTSYPMSSDILKISHPKWGHFRKGKSNRSSGRKIIKILEKNPKKDDKKYDEDDLPHMRKVVSYCKRHLAQEEKAKKDHSSKSYKSYVCLVTDLHSSVH